MKIWQEVSGFAEYSGLDFFLMMLNFKRQVQSEPLDI